MLISGGCDTGAGVVSGISFLLAYFLLIYFDKFHFNNVELPPNIWISQVLVGTFVI